MSADTGAGTAGPPSRRRTPGSRR
ncbi:hypothetical protein [Achromobacter sp.]